MNLSIKNISKTYDNKVQALKNVNLEIGNGMFGLLGPNGAGKSTLMRTIAALQDPDNGSITIGEIDVSTQKQELREILGYLPQEFGVYPKVSAHDLLDHMAVMKGITDSRKRKEAVESLLHQTNLWEAKDRKLGTYSGGMKQRFGIAQALLGDPKLIIVDEPTENLAKNIESSLPLLTQNGVLVTTEPMVPTGDVDEDDESKMATVSGFNNWIELIKTAQQQYYIAFIPVFEGTIVTFLKK